MDCAPWHSRENLILLVNNVSAYGLICPFCERKIARVRSRFNQSPHNGDYLFCPCGGSGVLCDRAPKKSSRARKWRVRKPTPQERVRIAVFKHVH
jgi:hypothetical protein